MSDADEGATDDPNTTTISLKIPQAYLDDLDATWRTENFPFRSEFIRWALRDAVKHPAFSRKGWKDIAASEHPLATGAEKTNSNDEIRARLNENTDAGE